MPPMTTNAPRARAMRATPYPRSALAVWMPMPTTSPALTWVGLNGSRVSSTILGAPKSAGVAAASTYGQRGVITAVPNERSLGLTRCTRTRLPPQKEPAIFFATRLKNPAVATPAFRELRPTATPASAAAAHGARPFSPTRVGVSDCSVSDWDVDRPMAASVASVATASEVGARSIGGANSGRGASDAAIEGGSIATAPARGREASKPRFEDLAASSDRERGEVTEINFDMASAADWRVTAGGSNVVLAVGGRGTAGRLNATAADSMTRTLPRIKAIATSVTLAPMAIARQGRAPAPRCTLKTRTIRRPSPDEAVIASAGERSGSFGSAAIVARHAAYSFADPVTATAISSQATSRSSSSCRCSHQTAGCQ